MKRLILVAAVAGIVLSFGIHEKARAFGWGIYMPVGAGSAEVDVEKDFPNMDDNYDAELYGYGVGFVMDTAVAKDSTLNYRLNFGYEYSEYDYEDVDMEHEFSRIILDNTLGFCLYQNAMYRFWMGPQLRLAYMWASDDLAYGNYRSVSSDVEAFGVGFAPVFGVNVHIRENLSFCMDTGYRFSYYAGDIDEEVRTDEDFGTFVNTWSGDYKAEETEFFFNFSFLVRL